MDEILRQPLMPASPARRRRIKSASYIALLLGLLVAGLGLLARTAVQDRLPERTEDQLARLARDSQGVHPAGSLQEILAHPDLIPSHNHPLLGRQAPDFVLADPEGTAWNLKELLADGPVVLVFYHSYCDLCVRQLFDGNKDLALFREVGARVVAISADPPESTRRRFEQSGPFGFPVLSDPGNKVAQAYEVFRRTQDGKMADRLLHGTFIVDRHGTVQWVNVGDAPFRRDPALLYQLAKIEGRLPSVQPGP